MVLNLLKKRISIKPSTLQKLQRYKKVLREVGKRRNSLKRRWTYLLQQRGSGFWQGLNECFGLSLNTRDANSYPLQGVDVVPARPKPISQVMKLLQEANIREEKGLHGLLETSLPPCQPGLYSSSTPRPLFRLPESQRRNGEG